jgi:hypothetical protein
MAIVPAEHIGAEVLWDQLGDGSINEKDILTSVITIRGILLCTMRASGFQTVSVWYDWRA